MSWSLEVSANLASNLAVGLEKTWCIEVPVWPWTNTGKQWQIPTMFGQMLMFESQSLNGLETSETRQTLKKWYHAKKGQTCKGIKESWCITRSYAANRHLHKKEDKQEQVMRVHHTEKAALKGRFDASYTPGFLFPPRTEPRQWMTRVLQVGHLNLDWTRSPYWEQIIRDFDEASLISTLPFTSLHPKQRS